MTRREFLKRIGWLLLSIPFVALISRWMREKTSAHTAMYYKRLAG